ncbi:MAG: Holliday junction branch migration protein RuvA [Coriobacteriales bacterium]|nr:Holliday junction branch migration protein RuvA [Coriobacteriales bacterium]
MIHSLRGTILLKTPNAVVIEVGGVGFMVSCSAKTVAAMPAIGEQAMVWTHMAVREDDISLYGFASQEERALFQKLLGVSSIGPKVALSALSTFDAPTLAQIIAAGEINRVATIPGVGKKTAQRIVLELKGNIEDLLSGVGSTPTLAGQVDDDALQALLAMGFAPDEAKLALEGYDGPSMDPSAAVRYALKRLGSRL